MGGRPGLSSFTISEVASLIRCPSQRTSMPATLSVQRKGSIYGHNAHPRTSTQPEARGIVDASWTCSVSVHHQRTPAEAVFFAERPRTDAAGALGVEE